MKWVIELNGESGNDIRCVSIEIEYCLTSKRSSTCNECLLMKIII